MVKRILLFAVAGLILAAGVYFFLFRSPQQMPSQQAAGASALPTPQVGIIVVQPAEVPYPVEYAGRVSGFRDIEVRARVGGLARAGLLRGGGTSGRAQQRDRQEQATHERSTRVGSTAPEAACGPGPAARRNANAGNGLRHL